MKKTAMMVVVILSGATLMSGCAMMHISARGARPIMMNAPQEKYDVKGSIKKNISLCFNYTGTIDISDAFSEEFARTGVDAVINTSIKIKGTVTDFLLNVVTFGIAKCSTAEVSGDTIKYRQ